MSKNQLLDLSFFDKSDEAKRNELALLSEPDKAALYVVIKEYLDKDLFALLRENLFAPQTKRKINCKVNNIEYEVQVGPGSETTKLVTSTTIDYDKAVAFAKEKGFDVPMTERIVIEPKVDQYKLQNCE